MARVSRVMPALLTSTSTRPKSTRNLLARFLDGIEVGDVDGVGLRGICGEGIDGVGRLLRVGFGAADHGDFRAFGGETFGDGFSDARGRLR